MFVVIYDDVKECSICLRFTIFLPRQNLIYPSLVSQATFTLTTFHKCFAIENFLLLVDCSNPLAKYKENNVKKWPTIYKLREEAYTAQYKRTDKEQNRPKLSQIIRF